MRALPVDNIELVETVYALRQIKSPQADKAYLVNNTGQQFYYDSADTTTADDGVNVFVPYGTLHRLKLKANTTQTFPTLAMMRATVGANSNPAIQGALYYINETNKQGFWYYSATDTTTTDNEGLTVVTTTGSHRMKRVFLNSSYVYKNWFTGSDSYFDSVAQANSTIPSGERKRGMRVFIMETVIEEYWYRDGTADSDLVPVAGDLLVTNGPTDNDQVDLLFAPDTSTLLCRSIKVSGVNGVDVTKVVDADEVEFIVDGAEAGTDLAGNYADRPVSPSDGTRFYQYDQLQGFYVYALGRWTFLADEDCIVFCRFNGASPGLTTSVSGTAGSSSAQDEDEFNEWLLETGTDAAGYGQLRTYQTLGTGGSSGKIIMHYTGVYLDTLSNGTDRYVARMGRAAGTNVPAIHFLYSDNINGGNWQCNTHDGSSGTSVDSGVAPVAGTPQDFTIVYDFSGTDNVKFYIDYTLVATITTNLPTVFTNGWPGSVSIGKTAGTTNRTMNIAGVIIKRIYSNV